MIQILMVEDDESIGLGVSYALQAEGMEVTVAKTFGQALPLIEKGAFDLALLDVGLPDGDGYSLCEAIRTKGDTPIIFLTAQDEEESVIKGFEIGADDYMTKPFRLQELLSRMKAVLRRSGKSGAKQAIVMGDVRIDPSTGKVYKKEQEVRFTPVEYQLLLALATHPGEVMSRETLLSHLWDLGGEFINKNTLTVYVKRLRTKLEDYPEEPTLIRTVRGVGYRMGEGQ